MIFYLKQLVNTQTVRCSSSDVVSEEDRRPSGSSASAAASLLKQKRQTFVGFGFINERICCFSLSFMAEDEELFYSFIE